LRTTLVDEPKLTQGIATAGGGAFDAAAAKAVGSDGSSV
jgi:hypothetical protein